jgi:hypothetical protein
MNEWMNLKKEKKKRRIFYCPCTSDMLLPLPLVPVALPLFIISSAVVLDDGDVSI